MTGLPIKVSYERRGSGSPLVLLHGIGHRWQAWEPVLDRLAVRHDVIALDLPGFGASPMLPADRKYDVPGSVEALAEVFEDLGVSNPHVAGNSLGGMLALELASRGLVRSATAFAPAGFWSARDRAWAIRVLSLLRMSARMPEPVQAALFNRKLGRMVGGSILFGRPSWLTAEILRGDLASMVACAGFDAVIEAGGRDYVYASPAPSVPVTVAWGSRDRILWPRQAAMAASLLPEARHVSLPRCGHVPMGDAPAKVADLIMTTCAESSATAAA